MPEVEPQYAGAQGNAYPVKDKALPTVDTLPCVPTEGSHHRTATQI